MGKKCFFIYLWPSLRQLNIIFDNYSHPEDPPKVLSKGRVDRGYERKISSLNQALPKLDEW